MDFIGLPTNTRTSEQWLLAEPAQRGTWLALYFYCAEAENGGVIPNCRRWTSRIWGNACAVTQEEVDSQCDLWWWEDDSLYVWGYDTIGEAKVLDKRRLNPREAGRLGGSKSTPAKAEAARLNGAKNTSPKQTQADPGGTQADTQATTQANPSEEKRREGKGGEEEKKNPHTPPARGAAVSLQHAQAWAVGDSMGNTSAKEIDPSVVEKWWNHRQSVGWVNGRDVPIVDWRADLTLWSLNEPSTTRPSSLHGLAPQKKEKGAQPDPEGWLAAWTAVCGDEVPPQRLGDAEPELQLRVRRWLFERSQAQKPSESSLTHA